MPGTAEAQAEAQAGISVGEPQVLALFQVKVAAELLDLIVDPQPAAGEAGLLIPQDHQIQPEPEARAAPETVLSHFMGLKP